MAKIAADVIVAGGGLAGSEAAWQLADRGLRVLLYEMRPGEMTPAHHTADLAELVCSNSMKSKVLPSAPALLKAELANLGSMILRTASATALPAGTALAVDRKAFSQAVTGAIEEHDSIEVAREELRDLADGRPTIVATGPLTSPAMERAIGAVVGGGSLHFYDAAAPLVEAASVDMSVAFAASRYGNMAGIVSASFSAAALAGISYLFRGLHPAHDPYLFKQYIVFLLMGAVIGELRQMYIKRELGVREELEREDRKSVV